ncbi:hypothetical protein PHMEG_0007308 [Phytophthora megakarya]|uniref:Uncharacterized protein n=1 Tax=Phytophthora megakarya TaxID=4795 RepID=A0A225WMS4_9STRA|nr:hypothetical protein PHMEG_0007308 [Phytophthora megakarya]
METNLVLRRGRTQARQPEGVPLVVLSSATFSQLRHSNEHQQQIDDEFNTAIRELEFVTVRCHLNGDALGLLPYPLRPPFREPLEAKLPSESTMDVDHNDQ